MPEGRLLIVYYKDPFVLVVLIVVGIQAYPLVEILVDDLSLPVGLRVISSRKL